MNPFVAPIIVVLTLSVLAAVGLTFYKLKRRRRLQADITALDTRRSSSNPLPWSSRAHDTPTVPLTRIVVEEPVDGIIITRGWDSGYPPTHSNDPNDPGYKNQWSQQRTFATYGVGAEMDPNSPVGKYDRARERYNRASEMREKQKEKDKELLSKIEEERERAVVAGHDGAGDGEGGSGGGDLGAGRMGMEGVAGSSRLPKG